MSVSDLKRRLARLETSGGRRLHLVEQFVGMTEDEAVQLHYGEDGPPPRADIVLVVNALTPPDVPYDWAGRRDDPDYPTWWEACRQSTRLPLKASA